MRKESLEILNRVVKIAIISALITGEKTFSDLKTLTNATDGNLEAQVAKLEELEYLEVKKEFINRKPRTTYALTELGVKDFKAYVQMLQVTIE